MRQDEAALRGIRLQRNIDRRRFRLNLKVQIVRQWRCIHQRRALGLEHKSWLLCAKLFGRVYRMERRHLGRPHRRQRHHDHRFGVAE